ncbi:MAG: hypothetical protein ISS63_15740 [Desulfobacteraceae bacterium]|nr:hypothetical protein [Desulfobacteraceae bacterium]
MKSVRRLTVNREHDNLSTKNKEKRIDRISKGDMIKKGYWFSKGPESYIREIGILFRDQIRLKKRG